MAKRERWPSGIRFRRFAAKIADSVMISGFKIGAGELQHCPLGCVGIYSHRPGPIESMFELRRRGLRHVNTDITGAFINGFENWGNDDEGDPYYRLGRAYRERFVEGRR